MAISADALQVYRGPRARSPGAAERRASAPRSSTGCWRSCPSTEEFSAGEFARARPRGDRRRARRRPAADRGRRHRPLPAGGAVDLDLRPPPPPGLRERLEAELGRARPRARCTPRLAERAPAAAAAIEPADRSRVVRALELLEMGEEPGAGRRGLAAVDRRDCATRRCSAASTMEREALYERIDARVDAMVAAGAAEEVRRADAAGRVAHRARGARLRRAAGGRRRGDEAAHAQLRQAPAHLDAQAARRAHRST